LTCVARYRVELEGRREAAFFHRIPARGDFAIPAKAGTHVHTRDEENGSRLSPGWRGYFLRTIAPIDQAISATHGFCVSMQRARLEVPTRPSMRYRLPCVYLLASAPRGTLYVGSTSDLPGRVWQHKNDLVPGFTRRYRIHALVWFEVHETIASAQLRENRIKEWKRLWKIQLVEATNQAWRDLHSDIL
jgi:putative endonuclease